MEDGGGGKEPPSASAERFIKGKQDKPQDKHAVLLTQHVNTPVPEDSSLLLLFLIITKFLVNSGEGWWGRGLWSPVSLCQNDPC